MSPTRHQDPITSGHWPDTLIHHLMRATPLFLLVCAIVLAVRMAEFITEAAREERATTVSALLIDPGRLASILERCDDDPGQFGETRLCINANAARRRAPEQEGRG